MSIVFSCIIPCSEKDKDSQNLKDLIASIKSQDFQQDQIEILVVTKGDSEQAKAIGIRKAKGKICAMFCADNQIVGNKLFKVVYDIYKEGCVASYTARYRHVKEDNSLNRYFSLIGGNDPVCYYLGKNDRWPQVEELKIESKYPKSYGCNGFFYRAEDIKKTDLDHYYPMDNAMEVKGEFRRIYSDSIWHKTSDKLVPFLKKRYKYARDLYCYRTDRRWKMLDTREDYFKLFLFVLYTCTIIQPLYVSIKGFKKVKDLAWAWHWPVCVGFLITYTILVCRNLIKHQFWFQASKEKKRSSVALEV